MNEQLQGGIDMETNHEVSAAVLGRLGNLGLGNPDGIPSEFAEYDEAALAAMAEKMPES